MRLLSMTATFGCLDHATLTFDENMTVLTALNGSGKSTWCAFLRTMLYGLDTRQRDRKDAPADKNRYRPWNGKPMEGLLVCEYRGAVIELRRTSEEGVPMGHFSAVYRDSGRAVPDLTGENAGEQLTGVGRDVFDRSVFLRQTGLAVNQSRELERRMAGLVTAGEEETSWSQADERLKGWQRRRRYHRTGLLPELEQEETELGQTLSQTASLRKELERVQARADALRRRRAEWDGYMEEALRRFRTEQQQRQAEAVTALAAAEQRVRKLTEEYEDEGPNAEETWKEIEELQDELEGRSRMMGIFVTVIVLLTLVGAAVYALPRYVPAFPLEIPQFPLLILAGAVGVLWVLTLVILLLKTLTDHREKKELRRLKARNVKVQERWCILDSAMEEARRQLAQARHYCESVDRESEPGLPTEAEACREELADTEQIAAALQGQLSALGDPVLLDARLDNVREETRRLQEDYDALEIAQEALREADSQLHNRFSPQLCDRAGEYLGKLTRGRYTRFSLTRDLEISVQEGDGPVLHPLSSMSQGTADQLYLALRLAVADLVLPRPEDCPLVLDDALTSFDDDRAALALDCLATLAESRQVILFTCQKRESKRLAGRSGVSFRRLGQTGIDGCQPEKTDV